MAQPYTTGPVDIWVAPLELGTATFLGHAERGPTISIKPSYSNLFVDLGGQTVPFDMLYDGEIGMVTADLTRWNQSVLQTLQNKAQTGALPGSDSPGSIGTLMITEGSAYNLWLHFPYAAKAAYATMPAGYRFLNAFLQADDQPSLGTKPKRVHLVWHCLRQFVAATPGGPLGNFTGTFNLFDFNMSAIAGQSIN